MALNPRRLALSLSLVGFVALPVLTGSLRRFWEQPSATYEALVEDRQAKFLKDHHTDDMSCTVADYLGEPQSQACREASRIGNVYERRTYRPNLPPLVRDALVGLLLPALIVLVMPRLWRGYVRWLKGGSRA